MKVSQEAKKRLFHEFEGLRLDSYLCPNNKWTIGWGATFYEDGSAVVKGQRITKDRADQLFEYHINYFEKRVLALVKVPLKQGQFDALVSFTYNLGVGQLKKSTLLKKLNAGLYDEVPNQFMRWIYPIHLPGIKRRRELEVVFYNKK